MAFDGYVMAAVTAELKEKIITGKIVKIYQPEKHMVVLRIRKGTENFQLLISAHPVTGRIHFSAQPKENPLQPPLFCMVLRKHLEGGRISSIEQKGLERVLHIQVDAFDEIGEQAKKLLVVEIMGKHSNMVLVDPKDGTILDGIKRYSHLVSRHREILPGREYLAPPDQNKLDALKTDEEEFRSTLLSLSLNTKVKNAIVNRFSGFSPLLAQEVICRAQLPDGVMIDVLGDYELIRLWQAMQEIIFAVNKHDFHPTVAQSPEKLLDFSCVQLLQFNPEHLQEFPYMSAALDYFFSRQEEEELFAARQRELLKVVKTEMDRVEKKLSLQMDKLRETEDMEQLRLWGELITAHIYQLSKGMETAELDNFYQPGERIRIPLNPHYSPSENAQTYFKKYNKAKSSKILVEEQVAKNREELDYLYSVGSFLEQARTLKDLEEIRSELVDAAYLKEKAQIKKGKAKEPVSQPLSFTSQEGYTILVGKNNKQNDLLTLKMAQKDDLWLHTKNIPGSHVIIRRQPGQEIPFATMEEAAKLAAFYSKARYSSQVPVDYTLVSQVKKPNGAKPGMVIYFEQKTLYVTP
ncbi:Rqc2 family fibronectin-binding protein [Candidatus Formimonas warabiya]|uniref:Rqc2 homolog RqcH n=1 Tax=Formimonas warabiya TaxID=1761012 RepID=A0A3G1KQW0_FORW1|nr:NFACT RNA binding domain-containing protein [Candidatus Formimonas warabiya]ATW24830.1 hypothetical protein DCMF_08630 [Candidatus Formimonas warabiya]